jgi:RNA polymerase sigma-70 factor (ECF subfamily)
MRDRGTYRPSVAFRLAESGPIPENREEVALRCGQPRRPRKYVGMGTVMATGPDEIDDLLKRAAEGDTQAATELFDRYRKRLRQMIRLRLDRRLQGRVDPSDVIQDAYIDVIEQLPAFLARPEMPFFLWLRLVAGQRLMRVHRQHLGAAMRDVGREVSLYKGALPQASSLSLAAHLLGRFTSASQAAVRAERQLQLQAALNGMDPMDREIIALRHFEELSNGEAAQVLGLSKTAASNRYVRAMMRLQAVLEAVPGFLDPPG